MISNRDDRAAGDIIPPLPKVNSLQALTRLRAKRGCEWSTFAFVLNRDMIKEDGSLDELHAVVFPLGSFDNEDRAEEHAKNVISITGHPGVIAAKYGTPVPLTTKFNPQVVTEVKVDMKGRLMKLESDQYERENEEFERRVKQERDIIKEAEDETDPDNIEHFKRQCFLAIKNRAAYQQHKREADMAWENYKIREANVRIHYAKHPEHEEHWLQYLRAKLIERGEMNLYMSLEAAYKEIKNELLGITDETDSVSDTESNTESCVNNNLSSEQSNYRSDNIICECPNNVCLGLDTSGQNNLQSETLDDSSSLSLVSSLTSDDSDCQGGICMATSTKTECPSNQPDNVICENGICRVVKSVSLTEQNVSSSSTDNGDELMPAENIINKQHQTEKCTTVNNGNTWYVDESDDETSLKA